jgi:hypothetical protein
MRGRRVALAVATVAAIASSGPAVASTSATTTATVTTWVAGQESPAAAGTATWTSTSKTSWQLDARAVGAPDVTTRIVATWVGPKRSYKRNATMLTVEATVRDQPAPTSADLTISEQYRICSKKCGRWVAGDLEGSPYLDLSSIPPGNSDSGLGLSVTWPGRTASLHVECRLVIDLQSADVGTVQVDLTG